MHLKNVNHVLDLIRQFVNIFTIFYQNLFYSNHIINKMKFNQYLLFSIKVNYLIINCNVIL